MIVDFRLGGDSLACSYELIMQKGATRCLIGYADAYVCLVGASFDPKASELPHVVVVIKTDW